MLVKKGEIIYNSQNMDKEMKQDKLSHAYILHGGGEESRWEYARQMAQRFVCTGGQALACGLCSHCQKAQKGIHPDINTLAPLAGKQEISVAQMRELTADAHISPNEAPAKAYLIAPADALNIAAQNAFLKTLEEPPGKVCFLLLCQTPGKLLPTVRSRCIVTSLGAQQDVIERSEEALFYKEAFFGALSKGPLPLAEFCAKLEKAERQVLIEFIEESYAQSIYLLGQGGQDKKRQNEIVALFGQLQEDVRFNVSGGHIAGKILASLA